MPTPSWKPGQSGNPKGRPKKGWTWADILTKVVNKKDPETKKKYKELVAEKLRTLAVNGDVQALKILMDRMDGLPKQSMDLKNNGGSFEGFTDAQAERLAQRMLEKKNPAVDKS